MANDGSTVHGGGKRRADGTASRLRAQSTTRGWVVPQFEIVTHLPLARERSYCDYGAPSPPTSARPQPA